MRGGVGGGSCENEGIGGGGGGLGGGRGGGGKVGDTEKLL